MRRRSAKRREVIPDAKYGDTLLATFINRLMRCGKKSVAEHVVYGALEIISKKMNEDPVEVFKKAMEEVKPQVEVRSRRVGGATYQVPIEVREVRRKTLAIRWIIMFAKKRAEKSMKEKLAAEFMDAANGQGASVKKRNDTHNMAYANKAFAHFRFN